VAFNRAMLGVYLQDAEIFTEGFRRTAEIDANTPLGKQASELLAAAERGDRP